MTKMQTRAFRLILANEPATGAEIDTAGHWLSGHKRINELVAMRLVKCAGRRKCRVTGSMAQVWRATKEGVRREGR